MVFKEAVRKIIPPFFLRVYHFKLALLGAFLYGFPGKGKSLKIIGVTGTSGKSTTVDFISRILEESGAKVASISSIRFKIAEKEWENKYKMTMPGRFVIQKFLKRAKNAGCKYVVLEVTSEGIRQFRHKFIDFDTAVFTNLGKEHIESHNGFENYRNEKLKLFKTTENIHVINADDKNASYFLETQVKSKNAFSIKDAKEINTKNGISFRFEGQKFELDLMGEFNIMNALAAICVAKNYGVGSEVCARALKKAKTIPGRMEPVSKNPLVVVDYAHTPEQLENVYRTLKSAGNLICVLGSCGGGRDKWKRPVLGKIASEYCKKIIITNEDPYDENPSQILSEIKSGILNSKFLLNSEELQRSGSIPNFYQILDRGKAIKKAMELANKEDIVIITGKGSEPWMCVAKGKKVPWSDKETVKKFVVAKNL